jgi:DNA-binding MarR family transcriptional regulator
VIEETGRLKASTDGVEEALAAAFGLKRTDFRCLRALLLGGPSTATNLAEVIGLTTGAMTTVVDRLEDAGLVERVHDRVDRRRILVGVTVSAEKQWNELWGPLSAESRQRLEHYSNAELAAIANFLRGGREDNERQIERLRTSE